MIAVVYSGSKTAFWKLAKDGKTVAECSMPGINPYFNDTKAILQMLNKKTVLINHAESIKKMYVFAAGASSAAKSEELTRTLAQFFKNSKIYVKDDLYGAAVSACFTDSGVVGILGSGAHCAYFDGKNLEANNFGLGFILGDEGSSNHLGKKLLISYLTEKLPEDLRIQLEAKYTIDRPTILERVYKKPLAQQYLSFFFDFFIENREHTFIQNCVDDAFETYTQLYLLPILKQHPGKDIHFVGIVAGHFQDRLRAVVKKHGFNITTITKEPIYNLLNYYSN
ncbi:hypothetical protein [Pedobacter sp.]|uniref:hypothetical protein n=1 Tax=Pedobacter sp. TaxID=1411316 RepID=UPI003D7F5EEE